MKVPTREGLAARRDSYLRQDDLNDVLVTWVAVQGAHHSGHLPGKQSKDIHINARYKPGIEKTGNAIGQQ